MGARRVLRSVSVALACGAAVGILFGGVYMRYAIEGWHRNSMSGLVAAWAVIVWIGSATVAGVAAWTWRTTFNKAANALAAAGLLGLYTAAQYLGHDFTPWPSVAIGTVSVLVLTLTAAAYVLSRREARSFRVE
jgi:hypothetical protein